MNLVQEISDNIILVERKRGSLLLDRFTRNHLFIPKNTNPLEFLEDLKKKDSIFKTYDDVVAHAKSYNIIDSCYYNVTYACNLHCQYCYAASNKKESVSFENHQKILHQLKKLKTQNLIFIGGEPLIHIEFEALLKEALAYPFNEIAIVTNGTFFSESLINLLKSTNRVTLQISLDGTSEAKNSLTRDKGSYDIVYKNILTLKGHKIPLRIMQTLVQENIDHALDFHKHFLELGIPVGFFVAKKNISNDVNKPSIEKILSLINALYTQTDDLLYALSTVKVADNMFFKEQGFPSIHCGAGINALSISPNGDVFPCVKITSPSFKMFNILDQKELNKFLELKKRKTILPLVNDIKECMNCEIKYFCGGGCRAEHLLNIPKLRLDCCQYYKSILNYYFEKMIEIYARNS